MTKHLNGIVHLKKKKHLELYEALNLLIYLQITTVIVKGISPIRIFNWKTNLKPQL